MSSAEYEARLRELREILKEREEEALKARAARDELNDRVREISARIRELRAEVAELRSKIDLLCQAKNRLLEEIRELKSKRERVREIVRELKRDMQERRERLRELRGLLGRKIPQEDELVSRLERLEWEYQTRSMDLEEEKIYVERINHTERLLVNVRRYNVLKEELGELRKEVESRLEEEREISEKIRELSERYMALKSELSRLREERDELRKRIEELAKKRDELKRKADEHHARFLAIGSEIRKLREEMRRVSLLLKAARLSKVVEERRRRLYEKAIEAREKYKRGEKITLEEFKLMMEFGLA